MFLPDPVGLHVKYFSDRPRVYIDIETSGLEPTEGACILAIGAMAQRFDDDTPKASTPTENFEVVVLPTNEQWEKASPEALKVNGMTLEYLKEHGVPLQEAIAEFTTFIARNFKPGESYFHVGQNPAFDIKFLRWAMGEELKFLGYPFYDSVNIIECFKTIQQIDRTLKTDRYNGHAISRALGVKEEDKVHTAMGGTEAVYRNYWALEGRYQQWISDLRREVLAGNLSRAIAIPIKVNSYEEWKAQSKDFGWTYTGTSTQYVDKDGQRYSCVWGVPPVLVKL